MARNDADVVIVGAGIAGLGLACALAQYDLKVLLIEKRRETGGIHRGDSLLPKATGLLEKWGVLGAIMAAGARPIERMEMHCPTRGRIYTAPLSAPNARTPYVVLPHAQIESVLMTEALATGRVDLIRPARVTGVVMDGDRIGGVEVKTAHQRFEVRARLVVGTDGARSTVREAMGIRGIPYEYDHAYLGLEADRPEGYEDAMRIHLHRDGGVLLMPRPDRVGIGVLVEAGSAGRWMAMGDDALHRALAERAPPLANVRIHRDGAHVYALKRVHAPRYVARGAVVIGDAVHCTNPTAGQGMAMALTDAGALADRIGPALIGDKRGLSFALADFEAVQWPANQRIVRQSHALALLYALRGPFWSGLKTGLIRTLAHPMGVRAVSPVVGAFLQQPSKNTPRPSHTTRLAAVGGKV